MGSHVLYDDYIPLYLPLPWLLCFIQTAPLPSHLFLKLNSSLKPLLTIPHWMILGLFLPLLHPPTILCPLLKLFVMMFSMPSLALILGRLEVLMESLLLFSKTVLPCLHHSWPNFSFSIYLLLPFLLAGSMLTFSLFQRIVIAAILQTTDL